jgi:hypothetical protein
LLLRRLEPVLARGRAVSAAESRLLNHVTHQRDDLSAALAQVSMILRQNGPMGSRIDGALLVIQEHAIANNKAQAVYEAQR